MASKYGPFKTKKEMLDRFRAQLEVANKYIATINTGDYEAKLIDIKMPNSYKEAQKIVDELLKINSKNFIVKDGEIIKIKNPSNLLIISKKMEVKIGPKTYSWKTEDFSAKEFSELLKAQEEVNKIRKTMRLSNISGINFKEGTDFKTALQIIKNKGEQTYILDRISGYKSGILKSLNKAYKIMGREFTDYDKERIDELIKKITNTSPINVWNKLINAIENIGETKLFEIYGSNQVDFRDTGLMLELFKQFNIPYTLLDENGKIINEYGKINLQGVNWG